MGLACSFSFLHGLRYPLWPGWGTVWKNLDISIVIDVQEIQFGHNWDDNVEVIYNTP